MDRINYDNRIFKSSSNSASGEVSAETEFHYFQNGDIVTATYSGGKIRTGQLIARALDDGSLDMRYHHINTDGELMTGKCISTPELLPTGKIRLHEKWQWTCRDYSAGESIIEEK